MSSHWGLTLVKTPNASTTHFRYEHIGIQIALWTYANPNICITCVGHNAGNLPRLCPTQDPSEAPTQADGIWFAVGRWVRESFVCIWHVKRDFPDHTTFREKSETQA